MGPQLRPHLLELLCPGVRLRGTVVTHVRVSDMMNETDIWLPMTSLELWPIPADETDEPERRDVGHVRKSSIEVVSEAGKGDTGHAPNELGFHVVKTPRRVLVLTANFAIRADLHVTNQTDISQTLDVFRGTFLPLTTATATPTSHDRKSGPFSRHFMMVNIDRVNLICDAAEAPPVMFPD